MMKVVNMILATGHFSGRGGHILRGSFMLERHKEAYFLSTSDDFLFDGAAEPGFALMSGLPRSSADQALRHMVKAARLGPLAPPGRFPYPEISGARKLAIGEIRNIAAFDTLVLWDYASSFLLGVGPFSLAKPSTR